MRFEIPTLPARPALPAEVSTKLTDAGHTALGFAAMAAKQANDSRLELNSRFEPQVRDLRKNAVNTVKTVSSARVRVADTVDPIVDRLVERLPETVSETVAETVAEMRKVGRQAAGTVEQRMIEAIEFATAIPTKAVRRTPTASVKTAAKTATKTASKTATKTATKTKAAAAKPVKSVNKTAKKTTATATRKTTARKAA